MFGKGVYLCECCLKFVHMSLFSSFCVYLSYIVHSGKIYMIKRRSERENVCVKYNTNMSAPKQVSGN